MSRLRDKIEQNGKENIPPSVYFPQNFQDVEHIIDCLQSGHSAIVNVSNMNTKDRYRILDFLSGYIYAVHGKRKKLEECIFLFTK